MLQRLIFTLVLVILMTHTSAVGAAPMPVPAPPIIGAKSYIVIDGKTGHELASLNPDRALRRPA